MLTYAKSRYRFGNLTYEEPSRFIEELPKENVEHIGSKWEAQSSQDFYFERQQQPNRYQEKTVTRNISSPKLTFTQGGHTPSKNFKPDNPALLQTGMEVEHQKFGAGKVVSLEGKEDNRVATMFFPGIGQKRIMLKFAKVMILNKDVTT
jgi:DNA helicase-2/ATP-dependent DNA helicase PcrA